MAIITLSIIFINILSQIFWSSGEGSELQNQRSWVQTPIGEKCDFEIFFFALFLDKNWYILYCDTLKKTEWKSLLLFKSI